jgi:hypothetical protein
MSQRLLLALLLAVVGTAVLCIVHFRSASGAMYAGKALSYWCDQLPPTVQMPGIGFTRMHRSSAIRLRQQTLGEIEDQAEAAINELGTNCLPVLLGRLQRDYSPVQFEARKVLAKLRIINPSEVGVWQDRREQALTGIVLLGSRADAILPELTRLQGNADPWLSAAAGYTVRQITADTPRLMTGQKNLMHR